MISLVNGATVEVNNLPVKTGRTVPALEYTQSTPAATWIITHNLNRFPIVDVYVGGELVETDVDSTSNVTTITFPIPYAGVAAFF